MADTGSPGMVLFAYISFALGGVLVVGGCIYMIIWAFCNKCLPCGWRSGAKADSRQVGHAKYMDKNLSGRGNASAQEGDTESLNYEGHTFLPRDATTGQDKDHKQTKAQVEETHRRSNGAVVSVHEENEVDMVRRESSKKKDDKKHQGMAIGAAAAATTTAVVAGATTIIVSEHEDNMDEGRHAMRIDNDRGLYDDQLDNSHTNLVQDEDTHTFMAAAVKDKSMGDGHRTINEHSESRPYIEDNIERRDYMAQPSSQQEESVVDQHTQPVEAIFNERLQTFSDDYTQEGSSTVIGDQEQEDWTSQGIDTQSKEFDEASAGRAAQMNMIQSGHEESTFKGISHGNWQEAIVDVTTDVDRNHVDSTLEVIKDRTSLLQESFGVEEVSYHQDSVEDVGRKGSIDEMVQRNSQGEPFFSDLADSMQKNYEIDDEVIYNSNDNGMSLIEKDDSFQVQQSNYPNDLSNSDVLEEVMNNDERLLQQLQDIDRQDSAQSTGGGIASIQTHLGEGSGAESTEVVNEQLINSATDEHESDEERGMSLAAVGVTGASLAGNKIVRKKKKRSSLFSKEHKSEDKQEVEMTSLATQDIDSPDENDAREGGKRKSKKEKEKEVKSKKREKQKEEELQRKLDKEQERERKKLLEREKKESKKLDKKQKALASTHNIVETSVPLVVTSRDDDSVEVETEKFTEERMGASQSANEEQRFNKEGHIVEAAAIPILETSKESQKKNKTKKEKEQEEKERRKEKEHLERESRKEKDRQKKEKELQIKREKEEEKLKKKQLEHEEKERKRISKKKKSEDSKELQQIDGDQEVRPSEAALLAASNVEGAKTHQVVDERPQEVENEIEDVQATALPMLAQDEKKEGKSKRAREKEEKERKKEQERLKRESKKGRERQQKEDELKQKREKEEEKLRRKQQEKDKMANKNKIKIEEEEMVERQHEQDHEVIAAAVPIVAAVKESKKDKENKKKSKKQNIEKAETSQKEEEEYHQAPTAAVPIVQQGEETAREEQKGEKERKKEREKEEKERKKELERQERESKKERERQKKEEEKLRKKQKEHEERESKKMKKKEREAIKTEMEGSRTDEEEQRVSYGEEILAGGKDIKKDKKSKKKEKDSKKKKKKDVGSRDEEDEGIENEQHNIREDQEVDNGLREDFSKNEHQREGSELKNVLYAAAPIAGTAAIGTVTAAVVTATDDRTSEHRPDVSPLGEAPDSAWQENNLTTAYDHEDHTTVVNKNLLPAEGDSDSLLVADSPGPRARSSPISYEEEEYQDSSFGATGGMAIKKELAVRDDEGYQTHDQDGDSSTHDIQFDRDNSGEQRHLIENDNFADTRHQTLEENGKSGVDMDQTHVNQGYEYIHNDEMRDETHFENMQDQRKSGLDMAQSYDNPGHEYSDEIIGEANGEDTKYDSQSNTDTTDLHRETEVYSRQDNSEVESEYITNIRASTTGTFDLEEAAESQLSTGKTEETSVTSTYRDAWESQSDQRETTGSLMAVAPSFTDEIQASSRQNNDDDDLPISKSILADIRQKRNLKVPIRSDSIESNENKDGTLFDELHTVLRSKKKDDRESAEIAYDVDDTKYTGNGKAANEHLTDEYDISKFNVRARASLFEKITENTGKKVIPSYGGVTATHSYIRPLSPTVMRLAEGASVKSGISDTTEHRDVMTDAESDQVEYHYKPSRDSLATTDRMTPSQDEQYEYQHKPARDSLVSQDLQSYHTDERGEQDIQGDESLTNGHFHTYDRNEDSFDEPVDAIKHSAEETHSELQYQVPETSTNHHLTNGDYMNDGQSENEFDRADGHQSFSEEPPEAQELDKSITNIKVKELNRMSVHDNFNSDVDTSMVF